MRVLAATSLTVLAMASASCPGPGLMGGADESTLSPMVRVEVDALMRLVADRFLRELAERDDEADPRVGAHVTEEPPSEAPDDAQAWGNLDLDEDQTAHAEGFERSSDDTHDEANDARIAREKSYEQHGVGDEPLLSSLSRETWIYQAPRHKSRRIGYLRAGAVVERARKSAGNSGCKGGWYRVSPEGYVCLGKTASLDPFHPIVEASRKRPKRDGLPYDYVLARMPGPPLYARLPSADEQARAEPDLGYLNRKLKSIERDPAFVPLPEAGSIPGPLVYGRTLPGLTDGKPRGADDLVVGHARLRSGFALLAQFDHEGRRFGLTTDLVTVPLDRTRWVKPTSFHGVTLGDDATLPLAFVMRKKATRFAWDEATGRMQAADALAHRQALPLTGKKHGAHLEAKDGSWLRAEDVRVIQPMTRAPTWATKGRRWIDISILDQSLVAYEGTTPKYVTLVSTGAGGIGDPKETHATIQGVFLIHTKHVTVTMDGDESGDEFDLRDVPFVQYFTEGYALHAAYWHDDFGIPRSHGCVNLAPDDAAWLFGWTTPEVPKDWHGALTLKHGTLVYTHP